MPIHRSDTPLRVGLVGAGPWATLVHAPMLAAGPETALVGVWARRFEAAAELAEHHGAKAFRQIEDLFDAADAIAFAVPPAVQAELASNAAAAGKALLLEKPIAADLDAAERLVTDVDRAGVPSLVVLTWRYAPTVRTFLAAASGESLTRGTGVFLSDGLVDGPFRTPWRLEHGPLLDLGPHVIDLLTAALGPVVDVRASGYRHGLVNVTLEHENGASSEAALSGSVADKPMSAYVEVSGETADLSVDCTTVPDEQTLATLRAELATTATSGQPHPLDAHHGLALQRILTAAENDLGV